MLAVVTEQEDFWVPLVDEPIGSLVDRIQAEEPEIDRLVRSPRRILAFKTFAYIRVGMLLGEVLVDEEVPADGPGTWVEALLRNPDHHARLVAAVREVAEQVAADPRYAADEELGPDEEARARFLEFARKRLS
jgi:hypothetical protein